MMDKNKSIEEQSNSKAQKWIEKIEKHPNWERVDIDWEAVDQIKKILDLYSKEYPQYTALQIADVVIEYCLERNIPLNYLKLHKIIVFLQLFYYTEYNQKLFKEDIYVYGFGVGVPIITETYGHNGSSSIRQSRKTMSPEQLEWWHISSLEKDHGGVDEVVIRRLTKYIERLAPLDMLNLNDLSWSFQCVNKAYDMESVLDIYAMSEEFKKKISCNRKGERKC